MTGCSSRPSSREVAIIRATTADERGNLSYEHEGGYLGPLDQALAVRNNGGIVIAQVKRLAASGTLRPHDVVVPGILVDYDRDRARSVADDAYGLRTRHFGRDLSAVVVVRTAEVRYRQGHRAAGSPGTARWRCGQHRLRHFRERAPDPDRGGQARRRDLGHRTGRRGGRAVARFPVRLRLQRRGDRAIARSIHLLPRRGLRHVAARHSCRSIASAPSTCPSSACGRMSRREQAASWTSPRARRRSSFPAIFTAGAGLAVADGQ